MRANAIHSHSQSSPQTDASVVATPRMQLTVVDPAPSVEILLAAEFSRRGLRTPASFGLRFPEAWKPTPLQNPHAQAVETETLWWLSSYGIGCDADERDKLRMFNCAMYGGYSLPQSDYEPTLLVTQFISLWLFWDDMQVEEHQDWDIDEVVGALVSLPRSSSRYVAAWSDIGRRLQAARSEAWLGRLATTMRQWLENAKIETAMAKRFRKGICPEIDTLLECRTISIGMYPTFHLIEHAAGFELPDVFHDHPAVIALKRSASRLVGLGNDLGGLAKDILNGWLNLVVVTQDRASLRLEDAFQRVVDIHNAEVVAFEGIVRELPVLDGKAGRLAELWVESLRYNVHGFTLWEATAERYQAQKAIVGQYPLVAPVVYASDVTPRP